MLRKSAAHDRPLSSDDPALRSGKLLLEFLLRIGADEFAVRLLYAGDEAKEDCDQLAGRLALAAIGERTRDCTVTYDNESNPRPINVWRLSRESIAALLEVMPEGVLGLDCFARAWPEDLCVYRGGHLLFGTITHERLAFLRLPDEEWRQWKAQAAVT